MEFWLCCKTDWYMSLFVCLNELPCFMCMLVRVYLVDLMSHVNPSGST